MSDPKLIQALEAIKKDIEEHGLDNEIVKEKKKPKKLKKVKRKLRRKYTRVKRKLNKEYDNMNRGYNVIAMFRDLGVGSKDLDALSANPKFKKIQQTWFWPSKEDAPIKELEAMMGIEPERKEAKKKPSKKKLVKKKVVKKKGKKVKK